MLVLPYDIGMSKILRTPLASRQAPVRYCYAETPLGSVLLSARNGALLGLHFTGHPLSPAPLDCWILDEAPFELVRSQLEEYFAGVRSDFDPELAPIGSPFESQVWNPLIGIPYGATLSYSEVALQIGRPKAARAVGAAIGRNPIAILVPCHRVIGANHELTGYAWGLARKAWLLDHEASHLVHNRQGQQQIEARQR